jgi:hypothetical protein
MALTRKYDSARSSAADDVSPSRMIELRMPVAPSDWTSKSGSEVVLLKQQASLSQAGALK